jgi:peroxiredoxin
MMLGLALAWVVIFVGSWLGWQLLRQNGRLLLRLEELEKRLDTLEFGEDDQPTGLSLGSDAPAFELPDLAGEQRSLAQYRGQPVLLIFFNPACGFCRELAPQLAALTQNNSQPSTFNSQPLVLIISSGDAEANRSLFEQRKVSCPVLLQKESEVAAAYQANGTPSGYLISAEGKLASSLTMGGDALLKLLEGERRKKNGEVNDGLLSPALSSNGGEGEAARANRFNNRSLTRSKLKRDGLKAGTPAPDFRLPRLDGHGELALSDLRGRQVLLVFSSPGCGPCNTLAPHLEKFHRANGGRAMNPLSDARPDEVGAGGEGKAEEAFVQVVMISKGEPKENRAKMKEHGLTFPIVLQQQWEISRRYAMFATPIAYLIDEHGIISHDVAVGIEPILALIAGVPRREDVKPILTA